MTTFKPRAAFGYEAGRMYLGQVPFVASTRQELNVNGGIPRDYFIAGFLIQLTGRLTISGGTTSGTVTAEAPYNLIERMEISGNHKVFGDTTRVLLQGSHVYQLGNIFGGMVHRNYASTPLSGAAASYDFDVTYMLDMIPQMIRPEEQLLYLLDAPLWNTLQLYFDWGGTGSLISGGDRTLALTSYGAGTGVPTAKIWRVTAKLKSNRFSLNPIPLKYTYKSVPIEANIADGLVTQLNVGNFIRSVGLVSGVRATGGSLASKGDNFLTLSDAYYNRIKVVRDDIPFRDVEWIPNQEIERDNKHLYQAFPTGYNLMDFAEQETLSTAYDTRDIALRNLRLELRGDVSGAADRRLHVIHYELGGVPIFNS